MSTLEKFAKILYVRIVHDTPRDRVMAPSDAVDVKDRLKTHPWVKSILDADIAPRTKDQYVRNLTVLMTLAGGRSLDTIITHPKAMFKRIDTKSDKLQTRKALVTSVRALAKYNPGIAKKYETDLGKWADKLRTLDRDIAERVGTAEPTEKELVNWVEWPEVLRKQQELGATSYGSIPHLLLSMYSLIEPIRADLGLVKLIREGTSEAIGPDDNYIVLSKYSNRSKLVLQTYKTSKRYGKFEREIPDQLVGIIYTSLRQEPREWLFVDDQGEPYRNRNSYNRFANRIFERIFQKRFTISLLRHSFVSNLNFNEATPGELFKHSKNMMHSIGMQQMYRRRIVPKLSVQRISSRGNRGRGNPHTARDETGGPRDEQQQQGDGHLLPDMPYSGRTLLV
jgi:integrase